MRRKSHRLFEENDKKRNRLHQKYLTKTLARYQKQFDETLEIRSSVKDFLSELKLLTHKEMLENVNVANQLNRKQLHYYILLLKLYSREPRPYDSYEIIRLNKLRITRANLQKYYSMRSLGSRNERGSRKIIKIIEMTKNYRNRTNEYAPIGFFALLAKLLHYVRLVLETVQTNFLIMRDICNDSRQTAFELAVLTVKGKRLIKTSVSEFTERIKAPEANRLTIQVTLNEVLQRSHFGYEDRLEGVSEVIKQYLELHEGFRKLSLNLLNLVKEIDEDEFFSTIVSEKIEYYFKKTHEILLLPYNHLKTNFSLLEEFYFYALVYDAIVRSGHLSNSEVDSKHEGIEPFSQLYDILFQRLNKKLISKDAYNLRKRVIKQTVKDYLQGRVPV